MPDWSLCLISKRCNQAIASLLTLVKRSSAMVASKGLDGAYLEYWYAAARNKQRSSSIQLFIPLAVAICLYYL